MDLEQKEAIEINNWNISQYESPDTFSMQSILYKLSEARVFWHKVEKYNHIFEQGHTILEIGAGQGWAGSFLKQKYRDKQIYISDISSYAIQVSSHWETFLSILLDKKMVCKSYAIPLEDDSVDTVFCYASAHHFVEHEKTLKEVYRVLKKGGHCVYLHEPSCRKYIYPLAHWRVNKKRPAVPEDVLVYKGIMQLGKKVGFSENSFVFDPIIVNREPFELIYYYLLQKISFLKYILPCTVDYILKK